MASQSQVNDQDLLTLKEAAAYLRISYTTAHAWASKGYLPGAFYIMSGKKKAWRVYRAVLQQHARPS